MSEAASEITGLLDAWSRGETEAFDRLMPLVISDLRKMAQAQLRRESPGHTLEPTALVNELYLRLIGKRSVNWQSRTQFFATMAQIMRRILVEHARRRRASKRGGDAVRVTFAKAMGIPEPGSDSEDVDLIALDEALNRLSGLDRRQGRIVELRYFGGLTLQETAETLEVSTMTVKREWRTARLWLLRDLGGFRPMAPGTAPGRS